MTLKAYNTLGRTVEPLVPIEPGHVRLYTCGPTVYNVAHIGNLRTFLWEDVLRRHLKAQGLRVTQVMNLTDIDDKTIEGAARAGPVPGRVHGPSTPTSSSGTSTGSASSARSGTRARPSTSPR